MFGGSSFAANPAPTVRELMRRLGSPIAAERCAAAIDLGDRGDKATEAIAGLIALFTDNANVVRKASTANSHVMFESETSPAEQAAFGLGRIGRAAVEPLLAVLAEKRKDPLEDRLRRHFAAVALGAAAARADLKEPRVIDSLVALLDPSNETFVIEGADAGLSLLLLKRDRSYWDQAKWKTWLLEHSTPAVK